MLRTEKLFKKIAVKIVVGDAEYLNSSLPTLKDYASNLTLAIRRELGFDDKEFTSQSSGSSATPTPGLTSLPPQVQECLAQIFVTRFMLPALQ